MLIDIYYQTRCLLFKSFIQGYHRYASPQFMFKPVILYMQATPCGILKHTHTHRPGKLAEISFASQFMNSLTEIDVISKRLKTHPYLPMSFKSRDEVHLNRCVMKPLSPPFTPPARSHDVFEPAHPFSPPAASA